MTICCIGDSLTEGDYGVFGKSGIANIHKENYPYFLSIISGHTVKNFGKCGFTSTSYLDYYNKGNVDVKNADIILVMLGTNGGLSDTEDTAGNADYNTLLEQLRTDSDGAKIVLMTPPNATVNPKYSNCGYNDRVKAAVGFVRRHASKNGYSLIDLAGYSEFCAENEEKYQSNDGLHFVKEGYKKMAEFVNFELNKILNEEGKTK